MRKLFGLFLLALAFLAPDLAQAASRFAICATTCTWDNSSTAMWSASSGGATGASAPVAGDDVTFDANTCTGGTTCTVTTFAGTISAATITWGACTASTTGCIIDASVNNTNFTLSSNGGTTFNGSGTGTRQWKAGTGTYALTSTNANGCFNMGTTTNSTGTVLSGATWSCSGATTSGRDWNGGGLSFGPTTFNTNSSNGTMRIVGANTFASLTIGAPYYMTFGNGFTQTLTTGLTISGGSSSAIVVLSSSDNNQAATLSLGSAISPSWVALRQITTSGGNALTATNCFDLKGNTLASSGSCTAPTGGGGGGGRIIGG
jgi:hypothetical protein